jgi:AcrR family transcriptional regulator
LSNRNDAQDDGSGRRRRKEARPAEIVEAARAVFVERGFGDAKVDEIARRAGASKGTVYLYYPTKEALFEAVMRTNVLSIIEGAGAVMAASDLPAPAQMRFLLTTLYRELIGTDRRRLIHLVIAEGPRFPSVLEFYHREVIERGKAIMTAVIERGIARGEFRATGIERHPKIVIGPALAAGLYLNLFNASDPLDLESYAETHIAGVLRMLGAEEGA